MQPAFDLPRFSSTDAPASQLLADLIVVPVFEDAEASGSAVDATGEELPSASLSGGFKARTGETSWSFAEAWRTRRVLLVGSGKQTEFSPERARRVGASMAIAARQHGVTQLAVHLPASFTEALVEALVEGVVLGNFDGGHFKTKPDARPFIASVELATTGDVARAIERGERVGEATNAARELVNQPGNHLTPRQFTAKGQSLLTLPGVTTELLDEDQMKALGMGLLLGVSRGSEEPPRLLVARYDPPQAPASPVLGLVGKGVTFDTGGISIKPSDGMERMKDDMAGGAAVIAALRAIAREALPLRVIAVVPATENMPSGTATKPGDVHISASGLTVEINNTDAEGRLILGDALWHAKQLGATHLIDVATLTGAIVVALGKITTGLFGTDGWSEIVQSSARLGGEKVWRLPIEDDYREALKSDIADMLNSPGRAAGAVTAAMFLKEFVGSTPWVHLDIAGTAWADETRPWTIKGATGVMVRTLVEVARTAGKDWP